MAKTVGDVVTNSRYMLQDEDAANYRWSEDKLYGILNAVFGEVWRLRPDLFLSTDWELPEYLPADSDDLFPIAPMYFQAVVTMLVGIVQADSDAVAPDSKSMTLQSMAKAMLQGGA